MARGSGSTTDRLRDAEDRIAALEGKEPRQYRDDPTRSPDLPKEPGSEQEETAGRELAQKEEPDPEETPKRGKKSAAKKSARKPQK